MSPKLDGDRPERRNNVDGTPYDAGRPGLRKPAMAKLVGHLVPLCREPAGILQRKFVETAAFRGWVIVVGPVMSNHVELAA